MFMIGDFIDGKYLDIFIMCQIVYVAKNAAFLEISCIVTHCFVI